MEFSTFKDAIKTFSNLRVGVVGDLILDSYYSGSIDRISPEAPVPVFDVQETFDRLGGAANVFANVLGCGAKAIIFSAVGDDAPGRRLRELVHDSGGKAVLAIDPDRRTSEKSRLLADRQQVVRFDRESRADIGAAAQDELATAIATELASLDAVIISDYAKGTLTGDFTERVIELCNAASVPVIVDPKGTDWSKYRGASAVTPNLKEAIAAGAKLDIDATPVAELGEGLRSHFGIDSVLITRGADGATLVTADGATDHPTHPIEVFDVTGAGDTAVAYVALGVGAKLALTDVVAIANLAASFVVQRVGVAHPSTNDLLGHARSVLGGRSAASKIFADASEAMPTIEAWRAAGATLSFTNGCFDIIHRGHVSYLAKARAFGSHLIVGLNTDRSVRQLKGPTRPICNQDDRAFVIASLESVDMVVLFDDETPAALIETVRPDVLAKGADYQIDQIVGAKFVLENGGRVERVALEEGYSTTDLLRRAAETPDKSDS